VNSKQDASTIFPRKTCRLARDSTAGVRAGLIVRPVWDNPRPKGCSTVAPAGWCLVHAAMPTVERLHAL